jgi:O-methyltransferase involved in polyketide biosynthesis
MSEIQDFVSRTILVIAAKRAIETERPDGLFEDPFAAKFAAAEILALKERRKKQDGNAFRLSAIRTRP